MQKSIKSITLKVLKIIVIISVSLLTFLFLAPILFPGTIAKNVKTFINKKLDGEINFSKTRLSFFNHFPTLTLTLYDFSLKGSEPYRKDTLLVAEQLGLGVDLKRLIFDKEVNINKIYVSNSFIDIKVDKEGKPNYNVYISDNPKDTTSSETSLRVEKIKIKNTHIRYSDLSLKMRVEAKGVKYMLGNGNLSNSVFDLETRIGIDSLDLYFDNEPYLKNKKIEADLVTNINTNSLAFIFKQNNLKINNLPIVFNGKLNFLKDGYNIDVEASSKNSKLEDFFNALPPQYVEWLKQTKLKGQTDILFTFKGNYKASKNIKPDLGFNMNIRNGFVQNGIAPIPASNVYLDLKVKMPNTEVNDLNVKVDSLFFNLGNDHLNAVIETKGIVNPFIKAKVKGKLDLATLDKAFGIPHIEIKGLLDTEATIEGIYNADKRLFPVTNAKIILQNGWLKTEAYPNPITQINVNADIVNTSGTYKNLKVNIKSSSFLFEDNPFHLTANLINFDDIDYNIKAKGEIDIAKIYKIFSRKGLDLNGYIKADLSLKGKQSYAVNGQYSKLDNKGTLELHNIKTTTEYFPKPFIIKKGLFKFNKDKMWFDKFQAIYGKSDFIMNGYLQNVIEFAFFNKKNILKGDFSVSSDLINIDEFMFLESVNYDIKIDSDIENVEKNKNTKETGVIVIPPNVNLKLKANANKLEYDSLNIHNFNGNLAINQGKVILQNTNFDLIDCKVLMDADYKNRGKSKADFNFHLKAENFDVKKAYNEIPLFREMVTAAGKAEGIISLDYTLKGILNGNMKPVYSSLKGGGVVSISKVKVSGLKMFTVISNKIGSKEIDNPDISKVDIKTTINNNVIDIERFKIGVALFRLRIEGKTNLNGQLGLKIRLGLPPLGIIGIPIVVKGTMDNPKIVLFSKSVDEVEAAKYSDSLGPGTDIGTFDNENGLDKTKDTLHTDSLNVSIKESEDKNATKEQQLGIKESNDENLEKNINSEYSDSDSIQKEKKKKSGGFFKSFFSWWKKIWKKK